MSATAPKTEAEQLPAPAPPFVIIAQDDVDTLIRVLTPFAVGGARGLCVKVTPRAPDQSRIRVEAKGLTSAQTELVAKRVQNIATVKSIGFARAQKAPPQEA